MPQMLNVMAQLLHQHSLPFSRCHSLCPQRWSSTRFFDRNSIFCVGAATLQSHNKRNIFESMTLKLVWKMLILYWPILLVRLFIVCSLIKKFYMQKHVSNWRSPLCKRRSMENCKDLRWILCAPLTNGNFQIYSNMQMPCELQVEDFNSSKEGDRREARKICREREGEEVGRNKVHYNVIAMLTLFS